MRGENLCFIGVFSEYHIFLLNPKGGAFIEAYGPGFWGS